MKETEGFYLFAYSFRYDIHYVIISNGFKMLEAMVSGMLKLLSPGRKP